MAISDTSITDVALTSTFEQWRLKTNQVITVLNEHSDDDPVTNLVSANSKGGFTINSISATGVLTGANVTGTRLLFSGSPEINFTGATVTDLGTVEKFALVESAGATVTGASPDSKIERCQINEVEINLNGKNLNANGSSTINFNGATVSDLGTVSQVTINEGTINDANVNITDDNGAKIVTISAAGPHPLSGATFGNGTFNNAVSVGGFTHSANISINADSSFVANVGAIFGSDVGTSNVAIGDFPEYTVGGGPISPTSSRGRLHIRSDFADAGTTNPTAAESTADELVLENENDVGMTFLSDIASNAHIMFGDSEDADVGGIVYNHDTDSMHIVTGTANTAVFGDEFGGYMQIVGGDTIGAQSGKLHVNVGSTDGTTGIWVDLNDADQQGIRVDANTAGCTANVFELRANVTTGHAMTLIHGLGTGTSHAMTGSMLAITDNNSSTDSRAIVDINQDTTGASGSIGLQVKTDGGSGIFVVQNADKAGLNVESSAAHTSSLGVFKSASTTSTGATLHVQGNSSTGGTKVVQFANSSADIMSARANGVTSCSRIECAAFLTTEHPTDAIHLLGVRDVGGTVVNLAT